MALDFPNAPTDGQIYTATSGEQWAYEAATNSWTSKGLVNTAGGLQYKGDLNITASPPAGAASGWQYSVNPGGTANAGFGPGVTGAIAKGSMLMYTGTGWIETSHAVPDATPTAKGIDTRKWDRTGTTLSPAIAGDAVDIDFPLGTAALPGLTPVGDPNTGVWSPGADQLAISTGGTSRVHVAADGKVGIGTSVPGSLLHVVGAPAELRVESTATSDGYIRFVNTGGAMSVGMSGAPGNVFLLNDRKNSHSAYQYIGGAAGAHVWHINNTERLRIDSGGRLLVGTSNSRAVQAYGAARVQIEGTDATSASASLICNSVNASASALVFGKTRGANLGAVTAVVADDTLGVLHFQGADGTQLLAGARITSEVDGTPGGNDMPGRLVFATTADGSVSPTERLRITSSGKVGIGTNAPTATLTVNGTTNIKATVYADNAAAKAGGLVAGDIYRKADGTLMITF